MGIYYKDFETVNEVLNAYASSRGISFEVSLEELPIPNIHINIEHRMYMLNLLEVPDVLEAALTIIVDYHNAKNLPCQRTKYSINKLKIEKVIFNPPATIVIWNDKTKTIVKCQNGEEFDPEKGMTMAFMKKINGNTGRYFEEIRKWVDKYEDECRTKSEKALKDMLSDAE